MAFNMEYALMPILQPMLLFLLAIGVFAGIYVGAIPGLSATMAVSLLISFTFGWQTNSALALMMGIWVGACYGGSRSAILLNIPGAPAAVATTLDGYPLAQKGEAGQAIGVATTQSVVGGLIGVLFMVFLSPPISKLALSFAPRDYLMLAIMGLLMVGSLGNKSVGKGILAAALGMLLGMVGMDPISGKVRMTFGATGLMSGVDYVCAMLGLFGASEALMQIKTKDVKAIKQKVDKIIPKFSSIIKHKWLTLQSAIIGVVIGALPGAGGDIAALVAYSQAKRTVKEPEVPFGEGAIEGLVAPETANNAAIGGALIPMLTMGIPGDAVTAIMIGAMFIHGLHPGPMLLNDTPHLFWFIVGSMVVANVFLLVFGLTGIKIFTKIVEIPKRILLPLIIILSVVGAFTINNSLFDIFWMLGFGVLGYFMKQYDYPVAPMVLGAILSNMMESNFRRSILSAGSMLGFLQSIFTSPLSIILFVAVLLILVMQSDFYKRFMEKRANTKTAA